MKLPRSWALQLFFAPKRLAPACVALLSFIGASSTALAEPIDLSEEGLEEPVSTITFDEVDIDDTAEVTTQFAGLGVTFLPNLFLRVGDNPDWQNVEGPNLRTGDPEVNPFTIRFGNALTSAAFVAIAQPPTPTTITAKLNGEEVESFETTVSIDNPDNYFGFTDITFDEIEVEYTAATRMRIDNLQLGQAAVSGGIDVVHGKDEVLDEGDPDGWDLTVFVVEPHLLTSENTDAEGTPNGTVTSWTAAFREDRADGEHTAAPVLAKRDTDSGEIVVVGVGDLVTPEEGGVVTLPWGVGTGSNKVDISEPNTEWLMGLYQGGPNGNNAGAVVPFAGGDQYPMFAWDTAADPPEPDDVVNAGHASPDAPAAREYQFNFTVTWGGGGDNDSDGMPNFYEEANGLDPDDPADAALDPDNDGLTNLQEFERRSDPKKADTDGDGLSDKVETGTGVWVSAEDTGTDARKADSDKDGLKDGVETNTGTFVDATNTGTSPLNDDTDGDGKKDGREVANATDPTDPNSPPPPDPNAVVVAYWALDDNLDDAVGDSHGELMDGDDDIPDFVEGKLGGALSLDGIGEFVEINPDNEDLLSGLNENGEQAGFSITAWFKVAAFEKSWQALVAKGEGNRWRIHRRGGESIMTGNGGNADVSAGSIAVDDDEWHHLALISTPEEGVVFYVDGELEGESGPPNLEDNSNPMMIGENPDARGRTWNGLVDDLAFYNVPITEEQVQELWNDGEGKTVGEVFLGLSGGPPFQITDIVREGNKVTITWPSRDGQSFIVEQTTDLQNFEELTDGHPSGGETTSFEVTLPDPAPVELYLRVKREE